MSDADRPATTWVGGLVAPGERRELAVAVSETYAGYSASIPVLVHRAARPGPAVFVTAAVHGDEINGTGAISRIIAEDPFTLVAGTLILAPVVNMLGFDRHSRYLPDRRDLNRSFPGVATGSMASRLARTVFDGIVRGCDWGIDLHTAAVRRANFPNVRADMTDPGLAAFARAFGTELIVSGKGPKGSLRRAACAAGARTLILEAGEVWKVEPTVVEYAVRGIGNCLAHLGMIDGPVAAPAYRLESSRTEWVRAARGGFLAFHVTPGDVVREGEPIATSTSLLGREQAVIAASCSGVVLGMTTLPAVAPGDPVCHIAVVEPDALADAVAARDALPHTSLHQRAQEHFASNMTVVTNDDHAAG